MVLRTNKVLKDLQESGSTWVFNNCSELEDGLVTRKYKGEQYVTHPWYLNAEKESARILVNKIKHYSVNEELLDFFIKEYEEKNSITLADEQKAGVKMMCSENFCILTGGPGTGKTSVLRCAIYCIQKLGLTKDSFCFVAPTGKAAQRMSESAHVYATTIHKKIGLCGADSNLHYIGEDFLFIDEASMIDLELFRQLLNCISKRTRTILLGDTQQLPSVSEGAVLRDLLDSGLIPSTNLEKTFRQNDSSKLFENIQIIKAGMKMSLSEGSDFKVINPSGRNANEIAVERYLENMKVYGLENTVLLCPYRQAGVCCTNVLNRIIQSKVNPTGAEINCGNKRFRKGDPIIFTKNMGNLANGETGIILSVSENRLLIRHTDGEIVLTEKEAEKLIDLAYAISINKSQGSEYKAVVIVALSEHRNLSRNMLFTGVTRAKKFCEVIAEDKVLKNACNVNANLERDTFLAEEIRIAYKASLIVANIL